MITTVLSPGIGRSTHPFVDRFHPDRPVDVNFYRPEGHRPDGPVVIVQHGILRNGDSYRDFWIPAAEKHGLLIVAPTFPNARFPGAETYNDGSIVGEDGTIAAPEYWTYSIPGRIIEALRAGGITTRTKVRLFGHSAGGQFVHRLLATQDHALFEEAMAANPGWYTLPNLEQRFPEGLGGLGFDHRALKRWFAYPMVIFAGDQDLRTDDPNLPVMDGAIRQGPTRYARARFMYSFARGEAERLGLEFNWKLVVVQGIGHDGAAMSRAAAAVWFEGRLPEAAELGAEASPVF
ncbi:alpha/beta hydrolase [Azospirillum griseum]|uniref:Alpha/beta hydrolase n=1 Tax=Azospirillum griseum TaxID=2496639 RepID=A0A3S0JDV5_9PROT|nr:alpha/beta hydrolase [Azospirillum griseum]RTR12769.1 alpha/beta hydrolase [Azospirillum griseum]